MPARADGLLEARDVYVGLMSGTSLDGISAAAVRFREHAGGLEPELLAFVVRPYDEPRRRRLAAALAGTTPAEYCRLDFDLGGWLADAAVAVIAEAGVPRAEVRAVCSHGQTVWHEPGHSTWQFGEPAVVAERTGVEVISDFRVADVAAGGQGAPLVPMADALLFSTASGFRALQNLGGIGNVTVVTPRGTASLAGVRAFDTGPGCAVVDGVVRTLRPALPYDVDGALARRGSPVRAVVDRLLEEPYFRAEPPKSTGRELFSAAYVQRLVALCRAERAAASDEDIVATAVALTARSIGDAYSRFVPEPLTDVLLSGGGAKNPALVDAIAAELPGRRVRRFDDEYFDGEAKEAVAFALLGWLHLRGRAGNVLGATGARGPRVLGKRTPAGRDAEPPA